MLFASVFGSRGVQSSGERGESGCGPVPAQLVRVVEERDVGPEGGERAKEQRAVLLAGKSRKTPPERAGDLTSQRKRRKEDRAMRGRSSADHRKW